MGKIGYQKLSALPPEIRNPLCDMGYGRADILVETAEKVSILSSGGDGYRAFAILIDLNSGTSKVMHGSWGGANPWNPTNPVDLDDKQYELPVNGCVIKGEEGGGHPVNATVILHPKAIAPWLSAGPVVTKEERFVLNCYRTLTSAGRKDILSGYGKTIESLVKGGYLSRAKNGSTKITTLGKNASLKED